jgi:hypothetical protein
VGGNEASQSVKQKNAALKEQSQRPLSKTLLFWLETGVQHLSANNKFPGNVRCRTNRPAGKNGKHQRKKMTPFRQKVDEEIKPDTNFYLTNNSLTK